MVDNSEFPMLNLSIAHTFSLWFMSTLPTVLKAPGMEVLKVPLNRACTVIAGISVWEWSGSAFDEGTEASEWFSSYLGKPSRLVRFDTSRFSVLSLRTYITLFICSCALHKA